MGGIAFVAVILVLGFLACLIFKTDMKEALPVLFMTLAFAVIGFIDDYLKVVKKQSEGLKAWQKLIMQFAATIGFTLYCYFCLPKGSYVIIPFTGYKLTNMGWAFIPFCFLCVVGTDNGTNFTDGLDGLLASVTIVVALFLVFVTRNISGSVALISGVVAGALMGYLLFNAHPAKLFMGDTGSLAIGAFVASAAIVSRIGWFILIFGMIYLIEVISVILQVGYFKLTKKFSKNHEGKRLFKMAPIHHHFELCGMSETQIVVMFTIFTLFMCGAAYVVLHWGF